MASKQGIFSKIKSLIKFHTRNFKANNIWALFYVLWVIWNKIFLRMNKKTGRVLKILMKIIQLITPVNHLYILYTCIPYIINVYYIFLSKHMAYTSGHIIGVFNQLTKSPGDQAY